MKEKTILIKPETVFKDYNKTENINVVYGPGSQLEPETWTTTFQLKEGTNPLLIDLQETFQKCLETARKKNNDYSGEKTQDPYKNFRNCEHIGIASVETGILTRMMDKVARVTNLLKQEAAVKEEAIEDTLDDLINYTAILKSYIKNKKK